MCCQLYFERGLRCPVYDTLLTVKCLLRCIYFILSERGLRSPVVARWTGDHHIRTSHESWACFTNISPHIPGDPCPDMPNAVERDVKPLYIILCVVLYLHTNACPLQLTMRCFYDMCSANCLLTSVSCMGHTRNVMI